jgi:hypothetical protein
MKRNIDHFMWGYQPHFRINRAFVAERLFQSLDKRFRPTIFLVGILENPELPGRFPACVEPEDDFWIQSDEFDRVLPLSSQLLKNYPETQIFHSHPVAEQNHREALYRTSVRDAVQNVIHEHSPQPEGLQFYVSYPAKVDSYLVCVVLGLQKCLVDSYYSLRQHTVQMHEYRSVPVSVSLIEAAVVEFLSESTEQLLKANPGMGSITSESDTEETLRAAGNRLVEGLVWRVDQNCISGIQNLFRSCTTISSLRYEKSPGSGRIMLARKDHPLIEEQVHFSVATSLSNFRASRKLLELTSKDLSLHTNSENVFGLVRLKGQPNEVEDIFEIQMIGHHHWELRHSDNVLMRVQYGIPRLPRLSFDEQKLRADLPRLFENIGNNDIDRLVELVRTAEQESHGTLLIVSEAAGSEADRLKSQSTPIQPCLLTPQILRHLTTIDGAIMLTPNGICHAIGVILDGMATENGDPGRGARYNSAVRYYESSHAACLAVVVSEDGGIDFIPNPRPVIRRSEIDSRIETLKNLAAGQKINRSRYVPLVEWLEEHRFYLREEDCAILNPLIDEIEEKLSNDSESRLKIIRGKFAPHPDMQEDFYYA